MGVLRCSCKPARCCRNSSACAQHRNACGSKLLLACSAQTLAHLAWPDNAYTRCAANVLHQVYSMMQAAVCTKWSKRGKHCTLTMQRTKQLLLHAHCYWLAHSCSCRECRHSVQACSWSWYLGGTCWRSIYICILCIGLRVLQAVGS